MKTEEAYRIAIVGIGGVGGYIGAKLATAYKGSNVNIIFLARGTHAEAIKKNGLKLITDKSEQLAYPATVFTEASHLEDIDLFILCTKTYQLEEAIKAISLSKNPNSKFLPLLNGIDASQRIKKIHPGAIVLEGCIYLMSRLTAPGIIQQSGEVNQIYFGQENGNKEELIFIEKLLSDAGLNASFIDNIKQTCWEKFFFISTVATATSYLNLGIGQILESDDCKALLMSLMKELKQVTDAKKIALPGDIINKTLTKLSAMPYQATSSMHSDFQKGNPVELEALTGYVVNLGREAGVTVPNYEKIYTSLLQKQGL